MDLLILVLYILKDIISGLIWGAAMFKFARNNPNRDEVRLTAVMFAAGSVLAIIPTAIIFAILLTDKINLKFFQKKPEDIENESKMELEDLYKYQKSRAVKKSLKYFVCTYVVVMVCAFCFGILKGIVQVIDELDNTPNYRIEQQEPVYEYL